MPGITQNITWKTFAYGQSVSNKVNLILGYIYCAYVYRLLYFFNFLCKQCTQHRSKSFSCRMHLPIRSALLVSCNNTDSKPMFWTLLWFFFFLILGFKENNNILPTYLHVCMQMSQCNLQSENPFFFFNSWG